VRQRDAHGGAFRAVRDAVLARDGGRCVKCGYGMCGIEVHHVYGYEDNNPEHLRTLCRACHDVAPMGDAYWEWERGGNNGWLRLARYMVEQVGVTMDAATAFLRDYEAVRTKALVMEKMAEARARKRTLTGRCEGRKPYGERPGEAEIVARIREMRAGGMSLERIADALNAEGVKPREGAQWWGSAVNGVLRRLARG
jgi:hypothetical protein